MKKTGNDYRCKVIATPMFGYLLYYPANDTAQQFADLFKSKALTKDQMDAINNLGFEIDIDSSETDKDNNENTL